MTKTRFFQILFSLAVIAALTLALAPAPVYALSASSTNVSISGSVTGQVGAPELPPSVLICRKVITWHNGHIIIIRACRWVDRTN